MFCGILFVCARLVVFVLFFFVCVRGRVVVCARFFVCTRVVAFVQGYFVCGRVVVCVCAGLVADICVCEDFFSV